MTGTCPHGENCRLEVCAGCGQVRHVIGLKWNLQGCAACFRKADR